MGFTKALQHAKYLYKISFDEGNFDIRKDFYKENLVRIEEIPCEEEGVQQDANNAKDNIVKI